MTRRGFTLLEILVSISILLLLAALSLPYAWSWLSRHELDAGEDHLTMQLVMARAAAREEGKPVEIIAEESAEGVETLQARFVSNQTESNTRAEFDEDDGADGEACIEASWARWTLPEGMTLGIRLADALDNDDAEVDREVDAAVSSRVVALFLPDGTALIAPTLILATTGGHARSLAIDPVTGRPRRAAPVIVSTEEDRPEFEPVSNDDATGDE